MPLSIYFNDRYILQQLFIVGKCDVIAVFPLHF